MTGSRSPLCTCASSLMTSGTAHAPAQPANVSTFGFSRENDEANRNDTRKWN